MTNKSEIRNILNGKYKRRLNNCSQPDFMIGMKSEKAQNASVQMSVQHNYIFFYFPARKKAFVFFFLKSVRVLSREDRAGVADVLFKNNCLLRLPHERSNDGTF